MFTTGSSNASEFLFEDGPGTQVLSNHFRNGKTPEQELKLDGMSVFEIYKGKGQMLFQRMSKHFRCVESGVNVPIKDPVHNALRNEGYTIAEIHGGPDGQSLYEKVMQSNGLNRGSRDSFVIPRREVDDLLAAIFG